MSVEGVYGHKNRLYYVKIVLNNSNKNSKLLIENLN